MRSTTRPTSRRTACAITPATWRWCAAHIAQIPIVLASATPSVETEVNARRGRYARLASAGALRRRSSCRRSRRSICARDGRRAAASSRRGSPRRVKIALERGEQALLFLNRRGYAPLTLCRACGFRFSCPNCDAWLVDHRFRRALVCHHCGYAMPHPANCPQCQAVRTRFVAGRPGRRAARRRGARAVSRTRACWCCRATSSPRSSACARSSPTSRRAASTSSSAPSSSPRATISRCSTWSASSTPISGLANGDPRAAERTFQLLHQVVGRAGREAGRGHGYLQTHQPEHPVMRALIAQDREAFYSAEIELREKTQYPPFGRLASLVVSGADKHATEAYARARCAAERRRAGDDVRVLGPAEAPLALVRGRHRCVCW